MERPEVICLSGSMRFYLLMLRVAEEETANGHIVLMPFVTVHDDQPDGEHKRMLDDLHFAKIRMSDRVIVVSDESGYYGESTSREIRHAGELGLPVEHRPVSASVPADDEAAVERIARALHRGAWERDIAKGIPLEDNDVDSCWSKVGAKYREWYYADARAALAALKIAFGVSENLAGVEAELAETKAAHRAALLGMTPSGKPTYEALEEHVADLVQENGVLRGELDEAQRSANFWQSQAETWEREHQNTVLPYTSQIEDERDEAQESRLQWAAEAIDAEARTDYVRWLHAEQAWSLQLAEEERLRLVAELEKATTALTDVMAERGEAARSARDSAVYAEQGWTETERLRARVADLEGQLAHAVSLRSDPASEAFRVRLEDDEPTPSDLRVAPSLGATPTEPGPDARVWARGAPQPDGVTHVLERAERHWCLNRADNVWYMREVAGPTLSWDDLLEGCGWVVEVVATDVQ